MADLPTTSKECFVVLDPQEQWWEIYNAIANPVGGGLTDAQLRATPVPVSISGGIAAAPSMANGQVAMSVSAATIVAARATRRGVIIKNLSTTISVYIGIATVTAANGFELKAGESVPIDFTGLIQGIAASATPTVSYIETYG